MPLPAAFQNSLFQAAVEPMQVDAPPEENDNQEEVPYVVENTTLDLESYAQCYRGLAKLNRLVYVADHCLTLRLEALTMAIKYVQQTHNVQMYQQIHKKLQDYANTDSSINIPAFDQQWVEITAKKAALKLEKLDTDLKNYKSNSIKESIRRGHDDLGDHYMECGDLTNAMKCYSRARDYCTSPRHAVSMCLNVIKVSVYLQNWSHVLTYVNKAQQQETADQSKDLGGHTITTKLKCAAGLAELAMKKYKSAAKNFLVANFDHCDFPELVSQSNVTIYGSLCALASFDRQELFKLVISSSSFKQFLELEPQLRDILHRFYDSKYASCLKMLDEIKDNLSLDLYLAPHITTLYAQIRHRALQQYFSPYLSSDMHKMADAFNSTVTALEDEIMNLILDGQINARIDSHNKILFAKDIDQRSSTFEKSLLMGLAYQRRTKALILRSALLKHQIHVKCPPRDDGQQEMSVAASSGIPARN